MSKWPLTSAFYIPCSTFDIRSRLAIAVALLTAPLGCHNYHFGARSLYAPDVATVHVPIFASDSFRPDVAEQLTEAVIKEIELKTPYEVVATPEADSVLIGRVARDSRHVLVEDFFDRPRELELSFYVEVSWLNRRRLPIHETVLALPPELVGISQSASLIPEAGESVAVSQQEAIQRLAEQIVAVMEQPW
jgi:hypothetical protein